MKTSLILRIVVVLICVFMAGAFLLGADKTPKFAASDHKTIDEYYTKVFGTLAPGSVNRAAFSPEIERALKVGERLPPQLEKKLERPPRELSEKLSAVPAGYQIYVLGHHLLILRNSNMEICDIIKNAGLTNEW